MVLIKHSRVSESLPEMCILIYLYEWNYIYHWYIFYVSVLNFMLGRCSYPHQTYLFDPGNPFLRTNQTVPEPLSFDALNLGSCPLESFGKILVTLIMLYKKYEWEYSWSEKVPHKYILYETHPSESINHVLMAYLEQAQARYLPYLLTDSLLHLYSCSLYGTQRILISNTLSVSYRWQLLWPLVLIPRPELEVQRTIFQLENKRQTI